MKIRRPLLAPALAALLLPASRPMSAQSYTVSKQAPLATTTTVSPFQIPVKLAQAAKCGAFNLLLPAGLYSVKIESLGSGKVRATFTGNGKTCQAAGTMVGGATSTLGGTSGVQSFASLGFTPQSQVVFQKIGTKLNVIVKGFSSNQILIGLTLA